MLNAIKQLTKNNYKGYPPCGREICQCLLYLDYDNINDKRSYYDCYKTWLDFTEQTRNHWIKSDKTGKSDK